MGAESSKTKVVEMKGSPEEEKRVQDEQDHTNAAENIQILKENFENEKNPIKKKQNEIKYTEFYCKSGSLSDLQKKICEKELRRLQEELRTMPIPEWEQAGPGQAGQADDDDDDDDGGLFSLFGGKKKSKKSKRTKSKRTKSKRTKSKRTKSKRTKSKRTKSKRTKK